MGKPKLPDGVTNWLVQWLVAIEKEAVLHPGGGRPLFCHQGGRVYSEIKWKESLPATECKQKCRQFPAAQNKTIVANQVSIPPPLGNQLPAAN